MITAKEVTKVVQKMANNKALRKVNIKVGLIKYARKRFTKDLAEY